LQWFFVEPDTPRIFLWENKVTIYLSLVLVAELALSNACLAGLSFPSETKAPRRLALFHVDLRCHEIFRFPATALQVVEMAEGALSDA
jgi:hypothetical protein